MGIYVRVFEPPSMSSGQLLDDDGTITSRIAGGLLVEVQLREGDRLYFSSLFREIQDNLKVCSYHVILDQSKFDIRNRANLTIPCPTVTVKTNPCTL